MGDRRRSSSGLWLQRNTLQTLVPVRSLPGRRSLRSTGTNRLLVPSVKRSTVGSRAFPVTDPKTWNALPEDNLPSLNTPFAANVAVQGVFSGHHHLILTAS